MQFYINEPNELKYVIKKSVQSISGERISSKISTLMMYFILPSPIVHMCDINHIDFGINIISDKMKYCSNYNKLTIKSGGGGLFVDLYK